MPNTEHKTIKGLGLHDEPLSFSHIKQITPIQSHLANFLKGFASEDVYYRKWDFDGDAIVDDFWIMDGDTGSSLFSPPATQELCGVLSGATGATDNNAISMRGQPVIKGDKRAYMHAHFSLSAVTSVQFEVGLIDAVTDATAPVITDVDTPASGNGGADIAVIHLDTDQTLTTAAFVCDGSTTGMNCAKTTLSPAFTPTADTMVCVRILVDVNDASLIVDNKRVYYVTKSKNIEGGTLLMPWLFFRTRVATTRTVKIDMVEIMGER